jgi:hypothetical protein
MIFNVNSLNRHFRNLAKKTRSWDIVVRNIEVIGGFAANRARPGAWQS